ncbi:MAG: OmpA family protein [Nitrospirae bacterium]|nr:OmpA family protein [Nitrospirota bacterium]
MQAFKITIMVASLAALAGCGSLEKDVKNADLSPICEKTHGWTAWSDVRCNPPPAAPRDLAGELAAAQKQNSALSSRVSDLERQLADRDRELASLRSGAGDSAKLASQLSAANSKNSSLESSLAAANSKNSSLEAQLAGMSGMTAEMASHKQRIAELERQLADRDKELAGLRGELSAEMAKLKEAQRGLLRALRPQIEKGDITVDLNNERLLINLASSYLFGSGQDELKPAGADALKQVGAVLKDYPEYKVAVDGHTDNVPIQGALKKKFPTNQELSESRAANAAKALEEGGLSAPATHGYADSKPVEPNTTPAGRAKNRRVEVRVTK